MKLVQYVPDAIDAQRAAWGNNIDPRGVLEPHKVYEVDREEVHSWHTKLWLVSAGGPFNSTHFDEVRA